MRGQIMVAQDNGGTWIWIYCKEAQVMFRAAELDDGQFAVKAIFPNRYGPHFLERVFEQGPELDVPDDIVMFTSAIAERHEETVGEIELAHGLSSGKERRKTISALLNIEEVDLALSGVGSDQQRSVAIRILVLIANARKK